MNVPDPADRLTAEQVAQRLGNSHKSVRRWMRSGVVANGKRVRLASLKVGGSRVTCGSWLAAFLAAQNPAGTVSPVRSPKEVERAGKAARRELAAILGR